MRRLALIVVLLVLLPLRGWAGDIMATRMATGWAAGAHAAPVQAGHHAEHAGMAAHSDCHLHADAAHAVADTSPPAHGDACSTCQVCQVCHAPALTSALPTLPAGPAAAPPPVEVARHDSAEPAPGFKPPIS